MSDLIDVIKKLRSLDVNSKTEKKGKLTYLSWTYAWAEVLKNCPTATYEVIKQDNGLPYVYDELTGYMVFTKMTIDGLTHEMWLHVMNSSNQAMKSKSYQMYGRDVLPATMIDINKTIMRCLVKNIAMFGLGLYIYAGEDLPEPLQIEDTEEYANLKAAKSVDELGKVFKSLSKDNQIKFKKLVTEFKLELENK